MIVTVNLPIILQQKKQTPETTKESLYHQFNHMQDV